MQRKLLTAVVALAVMGGGYSTGTAHAQSVRQVNPIGKPVVRMTLDEKIKYYQANVNSAKYTLAWFNQTPHRWMLDRVRYPAAYDTIAFTISFNRRLFSNASRNLKSALAARKALLTPRLPAHYAGWMCIHSYEGAWGATNPNGHYNGLQMTYNWLGIIKGNPNNYSPIQILWAAETGYANNHYSRSWLQGQWGQTIGPCWQYFD